MKPLRLIVAAASVGLLAIANPGSGHAAPFYTSSGDFSPGGTMTYEFSCTIPAEAIESFAFIGITQPNTLQIEDYVSEPSGPVSLSITIPGYLELLSVVEITGGCRWRMPESDPPVEGEVVNFADLFVVNGQLTPIGGFTSDPVSTDTASTAGTGGASGGSQLPATGSTTGVAVVGGVLLLTGGVLIATRRRAHTG